MFTNKLKKRIVFTIKILVIGLSFGFVGRELYVNTSLHEILRFLDKIDSVSLVFFISTVILVFVNWMMEAIKWKFLTREIEDLSFINSYKAVLSGITFALFTPNRIGEFAGKIMVLKKENRVKGTFLSLTGSYSQFINTILFGGISILLGLLIYSSKTIKIGISNFTLIILVGVVLIIGLILFFNLDKFLTLFSRFKFIRKYKDHFDVFNSLSKKNLLVVFGLSFIRYLVFIVQYYLLLRFFEISLSFINVVYCVGMVYFILTVIPSFALAELGIRGTVAILVFENFTPNMFGVVSAPVLLWFLNLAIPALLGSIVFSKLKI